MPPKTTRELNQRTGKEKVGKCSNPDYVPQGLWLKRTTKKRVFDKIEVLKDQGYKIDLSEVVEQLLVDWLKSHK